MTARATPVLARTSASAARYARVLPPKRVATRRRSAARTSVGDTAVRSLSTARITSAVSESSRSFVSRASARPRRGERRAPYRQRVERGRLSCPVRGGRHRAPARARPGRCRAPGRGPTATRTRRTSCPGRSTARSAAPSPRTRRGEPWLARDLPGREARTTSRRRTSVTAASTPRARRPWPGLEPDHQPDARGRHPDREKLGRRAIADAQAPRAAHHAAAPDDIRVRVLLEDDVRDLADRLPPGTCSRRP